MINSALILSISFFASIVLTSWLIAWGIPKLDQEKPGEKSTPASGTKIKAFNLKSTGFWIGFCETLLVFAFVYAGEYGALAIIMGAKGIVRKENIQDNPSYYLLGNLINVSVALVFAVTAKTLITH